MGGLSGSGGSTGGLSGSGGAPPSAGTGGAAGDGGAAGTASGGNGGQAGGSGGSMGGNGGAAGAPPTGCGDGVVGAGEECDAGPVNGGTCDPKTCLLPCAGTGEVRDPITGTCFYVIEGMFSWGKASEECAKTAGTLAVLDDPAERARLATKLTTGAAWVGGTQSGNKRPRLIQLCDGRADGWEWHVGQARVPFAGDVWDTAGGEPNDNPVGISCDNGDEDCAEAWFFKGLLLNDTNCLTTLRRAFCERSKGE